MTQKKNPDVLVVVLNYKGWSDTVFCIHSLQDQTYKNFKILLIENGSGDESLEKLSPMANKYPNLIFVENKVNTGFTGGVNQGIQYAIDNDFQYVVLFNNDAKADEKWLENLVKAASETKASTVTGLLLSEDGKTIDDSGDFYTNWGVPMLRDEGKPRSEASASGFVFGATGGATLYRTELFKEIGFFDNTFFAYNEDVDVSWRTQLADHKIYYEQSAVAYHKHSATSKKMPGFTTKQVFQNLPLVFWKNVPAGLLFPIGWRFMLAYWMFFVFKVGQGDIVPAARGVLRSIKLLPHAFRERRSIQRSKRVSTEYVEGLLVRGLPYKSVARLRNAFLPFSKKRKRR